MKKYVISLFLLFSFALLQGQNYVQGVPFDSTLNSGHYTGAGCSQQTMMTISLDSSLFTYVTGMQFMVVFDSVPGVLIGPAGQIHSGDTVVLDAAHPCVYDAVNTGGVNCWYRIILAGTPMIAGEAYPCHIQLDQCTCFCLDIVIRASQTDTSTCLVQAPDFVNETKEQTRLSVFPNPAANTLSVTGIAGKTKLCLYDPLGRPVMERETQVDAAFDTSHLPNGFYMLLITPAGKFSALQQIVIAR